MIVSLLILQNFWLIFTSGIQMTGLHVDKDPGWTAAEYPDIREKPWRDQCGSHVPQFGYICDPSPKALIKKEEAQFLNDMVIDLAKTTKCKCQRRSQCMTKFHGDSMPGANGAPNQQQPQVKIGFVAAVAFVHKISSQGLVSIDAIAEKFSKTVRTRWGLGDCGNMALILVWDEHQMIHISTDEDLASSYLTKKESERIIDSVREYTTNGEYLLAIEQILNQMKSEFNGVQEKPVDIGILALGISSGVAVVVVAIITICVCAFRCCGNLRNAPLKEMIDRVETLRTEFAATTVTNNNNSEKITLRPVLEDEDDVFSNRISDFGPVKNDDDDDESPTTIFLDGKHSLV